MPVSTSGPRPYGDRYFAVALLIAWVRGAGRLAMRVSLVVGGVPASLRIVDARLEATQRCEAAERVPRVVVRVEPVRRRRGGERVDQRVERVAAEQLLASAHHRRLAPARDGGDAAGQQA